MSSMVEIFCCYAREDQSFLKQLKKYLMPLQRQSLITIWADTDVGAGKEWESEIEKHLESAQIILLLVSPDFMASDYCYSKEMRRAVERHQQGQSQVVPIILSPIHWQDTPFSVLKALPQNAKPVTSWRNRNAAWFDIAEGIRHIVTQQLEGNAAPISNIERIQQTKPQKAITHLDINLLKSSKSPSDLFQKAVLEFEKITQTDYNQILLLARDSYSYSLVVVAEVLPQHKQSYRIAAFDGLIGSAYFEKKTINARNVREWPRYLPAVLETRSELIVPIIVKDTVLGVLNSESEEISHYDEKIQQASELLAAVLAEHLFFLGWRTDLKINELPIVSIRPH